MELSRLGAEQPCPTELELELERQNHPVNPPDLESK